MPEINIVNAYSAETETLDTKQIMIWPGEPSAADTRVDLLSLFRNVVLNTYNFPFTVTVTGEAEAAPATATLTLVDPTNPTANLVVDEQNITATLPAGETVFTAQMWADAINASTAEVTATVEEDGTILLTADEIGEAGNIIEISADETVISCSGDTLSGGHDDCYVGRITSGSIYLAENEYVKIPEKTDLYIPKENGPYYVALALSRGADADVEYEYIISNDIAGLGYNIIIPIEK